MNKLAFSWAAITLAASTLLSACGGGSVAGSGSGSGSVSSQAVTPTTVASFSATAEAPGQPGAAALSKPADKFEVAPYFEQWSSGTLMEARQNAGLGSATLAFAITDGSCALDRGFLGRLPDVRNFLAAGGQLRISFGGAAGVYAEVACQSDDQLFSLIENLMLDSGARRFDFDVEGHQLKDAQATARRSRVLARLQAKYPDFYLSFTLPAWINGLDSDSINLLKSTRAAGARIDMINLMVMSFGIDNVRTLVSPATVGQAAIVSFRATANQMTALYPDKSLTQLHAMMGMTPMIGTNDDGSTFTLADAQAVADFAKANGVGLIAYWSFQRDRAQSWSGMTPINSYSGVTQSNYQFHSIFKSAGG